MSRKRKTTPEPEIVTVQLSRCPKCGSAARTPYQHTKKLELAAETITWRPTRCLDCGQARIDKTKTARPAPRIPI